MSKSAFKANKNHKILTNYETLLMHVLVQPLLFILLVQTLTWI